MSGLNKVMIIGNVGKVEIKQTQSGLTLTTLSLATSQKFTNKQGQEVTETEWFNCVAFGKPAEIIAKYVQKGHKLYVEGSLKTEKYVDKNGVECRATKVIVRGVQLIERKPMDGDRPIEAKAASNEYANAETQEFYNDPIPF